jgi:hypothetical protein
MPKGKCQYNHKQNDKQNKNVHTNKMMMMMMMMIKLHGTKALRSWLYEFSISGVSTMTTDH